MRAQKKCTFEIRNGVGPLKWWSTDADCAFPTLDLVILFPTWKKRFWNDFMMFRDGMLNKFEQMEWVNVFAGSLGNVSTETNIDGALPTCEWVGWCGCMSRGWCWQRHGRKGFKLSGWNGHDGRWALSGNLCDRVLSETTPWWSVDDELRTQWAHYMRTYA